MAAEKGIESGSSAQLAGAGCYENNSDEDAAPADPYIPLMAEQAMTIDRKTLRSALVRYGISWGDDSKEAFACRLSFHVNALTRAIDNSRAANGMAAPAVGATDALQRLHDWAQAMDPKCTYTGDHPIAVARTALAGAASADHECRLKSGGAFCPVCEEMQAVAAPASGVSPELSQAMERLRAQIAWLRDGKIGDSVPMMSVSDMEVMFAALAGAAQIGTVRVPMHPTQAMRDVMDSEGWTWEDLLAAAEAITLEQHEEIAAGAAQGAEPGKAFSKYRLTWEEAEALCVRDEVDEALREFSHDSTGDNAIALARCLVESWLRHPQPPTGTEKKA